MLGALGLAVGAAIAGTVSPGKAGRTVTASPQVKQKLAKLANRFIQNGGQWDSRAKFMARAKNLNVWFEDDGVIYDYYRDVTSKGGSTREGQAMKMSFVGANPAAKTIGVDKLGIKTDFLTQGKRKMPPVESYSEVLSKNVYAGIDVRGYMDQNMPRYDLVVAPGANPAQIKLAFKGAESVRVKGSEIVLGTRVGDLHQGKLVAFQVINGARKDVEANFKLSGKQVCFQIGKYDHSKALVIDPLVYGSYYGGDSPAGWDEVRAVVADNNGGTYLTGSTWSSRFPAIFGPYGFNLQGSRDAFITKFQGDAYSHDYAAYLGGSLDDFGQYIQVDPFGDVWIAGRTQSSDFPGNSRRNVQFITTSAPFPTNGTFRLQYNAPGGPSTVRIPFNATAADIQTALEGIFGVGNSDVTLVSGGPTANTPSRFRVSLANQFPLLLSLGENRLTPRYQADKRPVNQSQVLQVDPSGNAPTAGTYTLTMNALTTVPLAFNANAAAIQAALAAITTGGATNVQVVNTARPTNNAAYPYLISFADGIALSPISVNNGGLTGGLLQIAQSDSYTVSWDQTSTKPTGGSFFMWVTTQFGFGPTGTMTWNTNAVNMEPAINGAGSVGAGNAYCFPVFPPAPATPPTTLPNRNMVVNFIGALLDTNTAVAFSPPGFPSGNNGLTPRPGMTFTKFSDIFVTRFRQSATTVLDPFPTKGVFFGGDLDETLAGFAVRPNDNPNPNDPIEMVLAGNTDNGNPIPDIPQPFSSNAWIARYHVIGGVIVRMDNTTRYVTSQTTIDMRGVAIDASGAVYVAGTVHSAGNFDTAVNPVFDTTLGVFDGGRLLRRNDIFARKYSPTGALVYSCLIGGNQDDVAGGWDFDLAHNVINTGSAIAVDNLGNAYITGISGSFNFPRTRGVFGEVFDNSANVTVTKLNTDASQIVYSTNLKTQFTSIPAGIAVDAQGNAFITGNIDPNIWFPENHGVTPGDPDQPDTNFVGVIQTTPDALDPIYDFPALPALITCEPWINVLNTTGTQLLYGSYLGGQLDDKVFAPYVDKFGDVWSAGWTDSARAYVLFSSTGTAVPHVVTNIALPPALISPLAFKAHGDQGGSISFNSSFGDWAPFPNFALSKVSMSYNRDGFLIKYRVGLASVQNVTLNPTTIPGGLGASTVGTVTLTSPAPLGGADITVQLDNPGAASFDSASQVTETTINIASGGTTGTFTVFSHAVPSNSQVQVKAIYLGSFKIAQLTVIPWLQNLAITPTTVIGGTQANVRVTLAAPAPAGGADVTMSSDNTGLIGFTPIVINVPAGQTSVVSPVNTGGVSVTTVTHITATLLGVSKTQSLTLTPCTLKNLTFNPISVAGGTSTTGTLNLNGKAGSDFTVDMTVSPNSSTPGYTVTTPVTFHVGDSSATFTVNTVFEAQHTTVTVTATRQPQGNYVFSSVTGTFSVESSDLVDFTIAPNPVNGGTGAVGTVTISAAAQTGGVIVNLSSSDPTVATVPATVVVAEGANTANFDITTISRALDHSVVITATRGSVVLSKTLVVNGVAFTLDVQPSTLVGGITNGVGTITLDREAPAEGVTINLVSSDPAAASVPASITITSGTTGTFAVTSHTVNSFHNVTITGTVNGGTATSNTVIQVEPITVASIVFNPSTVRGTRTTVCTITLSGDVPPNTLVTLSASNPNLLNLPAGVRFDAQHPRQVSFTVLANRVTRNLTTIVTANINGSTASTAVTVTR